MNEKQYINDDNLHQKTAEWLEAVKHNNRTDIHFNINNSALIVTDMQKYFFEEQYRGYCPAAKYILHNVLKLITFFRKNRKPIIFTKHLHNPDGSDLGVLKLWWEKMIDEGTEESDLIELLKPEKYEKIISKNRFSAFYKTDLEDYLKQNNITNLVFSGVMTNVCVESTVRDAFFRDFIPFIPADATAAKREIFHLSSLINMSYCCGIISKTDDIIGI